MHAFRLELGHLKISHRQFHRHSEARFSLSRLIHEIGLKTKIADGILLKNQRVPART